MKFIKSIYLRNLVYYVLLGIVLLYGIAYVYPILFGVAKSILIIFLLLVIADILMLFLPKDDIIASRVLPERLSNGDENELFIEIENNYKFKANLEIIDEIPHQFQKRDFHLLEQIKAGNRKKISYSLRPTERGIYDFGKLNIYAYTNIGLVARRFIFDEHQDVACYPSFLQLKKYELMAFTNRLHHFGMKKIRRIGHTMEFDQLKSYVTGDDIRHINWKASAKHNNLIINQYQDERAQPIYSIIDKGRVMQMPFEGLSLLDYAINATLVLSDIALRKHDKAGMLTFSNVVDNIVVAEKRNSQMQLIMEKLYHIQTDYKETDFGKLYEMAKRKIPHRSLFLVYTNFETMDALRRQLRYIKALSKFHLVVIIFFQNTELSNMIHKKAETTQQIYDKAIAEKFEYDKKLIAMELKKIGVHTVLTKPQDLTADTINKYLELKSRGLL